MENKYDKLRKQQYGKGITEERELTRPSFPGENHAIAFPSLARYNYLGPGTRVDLRNERGDKPINDLDMAASIHDNFYYKNAQEYKSGKIDKHQFIGNVKKSDSEFKERARKSKDAPILGKISANLIGAKEISESLFLPTSVFSGAGLKKLNNNNKEPSPLENLHKLVNKSKKNSNGNIEINMNDVLKNENPQQDGGVIPILAGIALSSILSALTGKAIDKLVDYFKNNDQTGKGISISENKINKISYLLTKPENEIKEQLLKM